MFVHYEPVFVAAMCNTLRCITELLHATGNIQNDGIQGVNKPGHL